MGKFRFKGCPKCNGDIYVDYDYLDGWTEKCIQCGLRRYLEELTDVKVEESRHQPKTDRRKDCAASAAN